MKFPTDGTSYQPRSSAVGDPVDIVSGEPLFVWPDKFESGCGWPHFTTMHAEGCAEIMNQVEEISDEH